MIAFFIICIISIFFFFIFYILLKKLYNFFNKFFLNFDEKALINTFFEFFRKIFKKKGWFTSSNNNIKLDCKSKELVTFSGVSLLNSIYYYFRYTFWKVSIYFKFNHIFFILLYTFIYITDILSKIVIFFYNYLNSYIFTEKNDKSLVIWSASNIKIENFINYYYKAFMKKLFYPFFYKIKKDKVFDNTITINNSNIFELFKRILAYIKVNIWNILYLKNYYYLFVSFFYLVLGIDIPVFFDVNLIEEIFIVGSIGAASFGLYSIAKYIYLKFKNSQTPNQFDTEGYTPTESNNDISDLKNSDQENSNFDEEFSQKSYDQELKKQDNSLLEDIIENENNIDYDNTLTEEDFAANLEELDFVIQKNEIEVCNSNNYYNVLTTDINGNIVNLVKDTTEYIILSNQISVKNMDEFLNFAKNYDKVLDVALLSSYKFNNYSILFNDFTSLESIYLKNRKYRDPNLLMTKHIVYSILNSNDESIYAFDLKRINNILTELLENEKNENNENTFLSEKYFHDIMIKRSEKLGDISSFSKNFKNYISKKKKNKKKLMFKLPNKFINIIRLKKKYDKVDSLNDITSILNQFKYIQVNIGTFLKYNKELNTIEALLKYQQYLILYEKYNNYYIFKKKILDDLFIKINKSKSLNSKKYNFFEFLRKKTGYFFNKTQKNIFDLDLFIKKHNNFISFNEYAISLLNKDVPIDTILKNLKNVDDFYNIYKDCYVFDLKGNLKNADNNLIDLFSIFKRLNLKDLTLFDPYLYRKMVYNDTFNFKLSGIGFYDQKLISDSYQYNFDLILGLFEYIKSIELESYKFTLLTFDIYSCDLITNSALYPIFVNLFNNLCKNISDINGSQLHFFLKKVELMDKLNDLLSTFKIKNFISLYSTNQQLNLTQEELINNLFEIERTLFDLTFELEQFENLVDDFRIELIQMLYELDSINCDIFFTNDIFKKSKLGILLEYGYKSFYNYLVESERITDYFCQCLLNNLNVWNAHYYNSRQRLLVEFHFLPKQPEGLTIKEVELLINEVEPVNPLIFIQLYNQLQKDTRAPLYHYNIKFRELIFTIMDIEDDTNDEPENIILTNKYQGASDISLFNNFLNKIGSRPIIIYPLKKKDKNLLLQDLKDAAYSNLRVDIDPENDLDNIIKDSILYTKYKTNNIIYDWDNKQFISTNISDEKPIYDLDNIVVNNTGICSNPDIIDIEYICVNDDFELNFNYDLHYKKQNNEFNKNVYSQVFDNKNFLFFLDKNKNLILKKNLIFFFDNNFLEYLYKSLVLTSKNNQIKLTSNAFLYKLECNLINFKFYLNINMVNLYNDSYNDIIYDISYINSHIDNLLNLNKKAVLLNDFKISNKFFFFDIAEIEQNKKRILLINWFEGCNDVDILKAYPLSIKSQSNINKKYPWIKNFFGVMKEHFERCNFLHQFTLMFNDLILLPDELQFMSKKNNEFDFFIYKKNLNKNIVKLNNEINSLLLEMQTKSNVIRNFQNLLSKMTNSNAFHIISSIYFVKSLDDLIYAFANKLDNNNNELNMLKNKLIKLKNISSFFNLFGVTSNSLNIFKILHEECNWYFFNMNKIVYLFNFIHNIEDDIYEISLNETYFNLAFDNLDRYKSILNFDNMYLDINNNSIYEFFDINNIKWYENKYEVKLLEENTDTFNFTTIKDIFKKIKNTDSKENLEDIGFTYLQQNTNAALNIVSENDVNYNIAETIIDNNRPGTSSSSTLKVYSKGKFVCNSRSFFLKKRSKSINNIDFYNKRILRSLKKSLYKVDQKKLKELCPNIDFIVRARYAITKGKNHKIFTHNIKKFFYNLFYRKDLHYKLYYFFNVNRPNINFTSLDFLDSEEEALDTLISKKKSTTTFLNEHKEDKDSGILKYAGDDYNISHYKRGQGIVTDLFNIRMHEMDAVYLKLRKKAEDLVSFYINNPDDVFWDDIYPEFNDPMIRKIFISNFTTEEIDSLVSLLYDSYAKEYEAMCEKMKKNYEIISNLNFTTFMQIPKKEQQKFCDSFFFYQAELTPQEKSFDLYKNIALPFSYDYKADLHFNVFSRFRKKAKGTNLPLFNFKKYGKKRKQKKIEE